MPAPSATRRSRLEGWYWRIVDERRRRVVVALCGVCRPRRGAPWAVVALAGHPGGAVSWRTVDGAAGDPDRFGAWASPALVGGDRALRVAVGRDRLDVSFDAALCTARPSLGLAHAIPGLPQYWHAHLLGARVSGEARLGGEVWDLDGATAYAEKNWGPRFAPDWWWGQGFLEEDVAVAFAGGRMGPLAPTGAVVRLGRSVHRLVPPLAVVTAEAADGAWRVVGRGARLRVRIEGDGREMPPHVLPVPAVEERACHLRSRQHLAGRIRLEVREGRRLAFSGETELGGLERGLPPGAPPG